jgi:ATP-dependent RNA helicase DDX56/DBP9
VLQNVLVSGAGSAASQVLAIVLIPTKELSRQVKMDVESLCRYCGDEVTVVELSAAAETVKEQKALLRDRPTIVIATPARIAARIADKSLDVKHCTSLVVDEADLVLGYGYSEDVSAIVRAMPTSRQTFLMSATLGREVEKLRKEMLNRPAVLTLNVRSSFFLCFFFFFLFFFFL